MKTYGIRELQRRPGEIVDQVEQGRRPALVTRHGKPAAVLLPIDSDAFEAWVLANAPEYVADLEQAEVDLRERQTRPADEVLAEIEAEDPKKRR
ncbi:MAG: type II toxin-antitoxin system Phd/YefM family antitoxin [Actinomycetota bacterium]|nr:type II toxin-antitoxin system Phd/YefM family antitoxin [Actinomycetota bacterium]